MNKIEPIKVFSDNEGYKYVEDKSKGNIWEIEAKDLIYINKINEILAFVNETAKEENKCK